jgi:hypothetical protein
MEAAAAAAAAANYSGNDRSIGTFSRTRSNFLKRYVK